MASYSFSRTDTSLKYGVKDHFAGYFVQLRLLFTDCANFTLHLKFIARTSEAEVHIQLLPADTQSFQVYIPGFLVLHK